MAAQGLILLPELYVQRIIEIGIKENKKRYIERGRGVELECVLMCLCCWLIQAAGIVVLMCEFWELHKKGF